MGILWGDCKEPPVACILQQELGRGAPGVLGVGAGREQDGRAPCVSSPFVYLLCMPTGPGSWRMSRRGRADGEGTISHRSQLNCDIQHMPTMCLLCASVALGTGDRAGDGIGP